MDKMLILKIAWSKRQIKILNVLEGRLRLRFVMVIFAISIIESMLDFPVIAPMNRMIPIISDSGVGLEIFFLETFEILMNPKSVMVD